MQLAVPDELDDKTASQFYVSVHMSCGHDFNLLSILTSIVLLMLALRSDETLQCLAPRPSLQCFHWIAVVGAMRFCCLTPAAAGDMK